jgi:hypothetical protein
MLLSWIPRLFPIGQRRGKSAPCLRRTHRRQCCLRRRRGARSGGISVSAIIRGMYWSATEAKLVGYESLLELSRLLMADFDRSSKRIVSQPFQIKAGIEGERLTRIPDYLVLGEEEPLVIDVTRKARMDKPKYARLFDLTRRVVESRGWKYELAHEPPRTEYLNIRFLAGYRRPWLFDESVVDEVRRAAESSPGSTIGEIACGTSYPKRAALPALMHLLWRQDLTVDITERLSPTTVVWARP